MTKTPELRTRLVVDLGPLIEGWTDLVTVGIGFDGAIYAVARRSNEALTETLANGIFPKSRAWGVGGDLFFFKDNRVLVAEAW